LFKTVKIGGKMFGKKILVSLLTCLLIAMSLEATSLAVAEPQEVEFVGTWGYPRPPTGHFNPYLPYAIYPSGLTWDKLAYYIRLTEEFVPSLATSWKLDREKGQITVNLRRGVVWHDGVSFTSKDVWCTFILGKLFKWRIWDYVTKIETPDDFTIIFYFSPEKFSIFLEQWILNQYIYAPYHIYGKFADEVAIAKTDEEMQTILTEFSNFKPEKLIGTGPFILESVTESEMVLKKNLKHWTADIIKIDVVRVPNSLTAEASWALYFAGEADYGWPGTPKKVEEEILKRPYMHLITPTDVAGPAVWFNTKKYPLNITEVRQAIAYVIDRKTACEVTGVPWLPAETPHGILADVEKKWVSDELRAKLNNYECNPTKAEEILKGLGFTKDPDGIWVTPKGTKFAVEVTAPAGWVDTVMMMENVAAQLKAFGIDATFRTPEVTKYWAEDFPEGKYDITWGWWGYWHFHPYASFYNIFMYFNGYRYPGHGFGRRAVLDGEEVDLWDLVSTLEKTVEFEEQRAIVEKLIRILNYYLPVLPMGEKHIQVFYSTKRFTNWPSVVERYDLWQNCPGDAVGALSLMMQLGYIKPVGVAPPPVTVPPELEELPEAVRNIADKISDMAGEISAVREDLHSLAAQVSSLTSSLMATQIITIILLLAVLVFMLRRKPGT
jgi:peptide/nickel transport system substrate-binding protein